MITPIPHRVLPLALLVALVGPGQESRPVGAGLDREIQEKLPRIRQLMRDGILQLKPAAASVARTSSQGARTTFAGSFDRHSNMAAWWSLLCWARSTGDVRDLQGLLDRFTHDTLQVEREFTAATVGKSPLDPYEDTWLLMLLREIERSTQDGAVADLARTFGDEVEDRVLAFVEGAALLTGEDGKPIAEPTATRPAESRPTSGPTTRGPRASRIPRDQWMSGSYDSAAWSLLILHLSQPSRATTIARRLAADAGPYRRARTALGARVSSSPWAPNNYEFLWAPSLFDAVDTLGGRGGRVGAAAPAVAPYVPPPSPINLGNCHTLGAEISKLWPVALAAAHGNATARAILNQRLSQDLSDEAWWVGSFLTVSHWVPQFIWLTVWLADGRP